MKHNLEKIKKSSLIELYETDSMIDNEFVNIIVHQPSGARTELLLELRKAIRDEICKHKQED